MSSNRTMIINCGASHVSASAFSSNGGSLVLEDFAIQQLDYDYSVDEAWSGALPDAVKSVVGQLKSKAAATFIAPGYQLLTKSIKVPHVEGPKQAQIIAFQAQQNIPYPLTEVVWDSQVIADDGIETEVILIAIKSDVINGFCGQMGANNVPPQSVQAASILDYNAYKLAYPGDSEDTLLINIGARSSNLLFINESGFFVRNIALGGNSLTQNLADNLGKPFSQAESIKVAYFSGKTSYESDHPSAQILEKTSQSFLQRMAQEVTRSIVNFRRQRSAKAPTRILLTGKGSLLPGLAEHLTKTQKGIPVETFNPIDSIQMGGGVDEGFVRDNVHSLSEVLGEACRLVSDDAVSINLLPTALASQMAFKRKKPFLVMAAALLALSTAAPFVHFSAVKSLYEKEEQAIRSRIAPLRSAQSSLYDNGEKAKSLVTQVQNLERLVNTKSNWITFLSDLQQRLQGVQDVWLDDLSIDRANANSMNLRGRLLIRHYDPDNPTKSSEAASRRVSSLLDSFKESEFVSDVTSIKFNSKDPRILEFNFSLVSNAEKPL